jgi:hypothetical protein
VGLESQGGGAWLHARQAGTMVGDAILQGRESCAEKQPDQIGERIMSCMVSRKA